jgi:hypothetical protein
MSSTAVQRRRGTTAEHATFAGLNGETTVDTTKKTVVVHDGATAGGNPLLREDGSNSALALGSAATPSLKFTGDPNTGIYSPGADQVAISTNGTGRLYIAADGKIGVGTASPDVFSRGDASILGIASTGSASVAINAGSGNSAFLQLGANGSRIFQIQATATETYLQNAGATPIVFATSFNERMRLTADGKLGLGTSSPGVPFDLKLTSSTTYSATTAADNAIAIYNDSNTTGAFGSLKILTRNANDTAGSVNLVGLSTSTNFASDFAIQQRTTAGVYRENLRITHDGKVGIGTTTPSNLLTVVAPATSAWNTAASFEGGGNADNAGSRVYITPAGGGGFGGVIYGGRWASADRGIRLVGINQGGAERSYVHINGEGDTVTFGTASTERARIDGSGRLLVGTSTARSNFFNSTGIAPRLQVEGNSAETAAVSIVRTSNESQAPSLIFGKTRDSAYALVSDGDDLGRMLFMGADGSELVEAASIIAEVDGTPGANDMPGRLVFSTTADGASSPTERMRITSDAYVRLASGTGGIQFNGDTAAANALDDYEEGTFTPTINGSTTAGTGTYTIQSGRYTKIGRQVYCAGTVSWSAHDGTGNMRIAGLPFSSVNVTELWNAATFSYVSGITQGANTFLLGANATSTSLITLYQVAVGGGTPSGVGLDSAATIYFSITYQTA